jgi:dihydrofolate reductase
MIAIVAIDEGGGIGKNGDLPWPKIKEDFKWFRKKTTEVGRLIMGRKTWDSLPVGGLPNRWCYVLTKNYWTEYGIIHDCFDHALAVNDIKGVPQDGIVCGGANVYKQLIPLCEELYVTHIKGVYSADTWFPFSQAEIDKMFPYKYFITSFEGGHQVIKYSKK